MMEDMLLGAALVIAPLVLWLTWANVRREPKKPDCYGDYPFLNGQVAAERCCHDCPAAAGCYGESPTPKGFHT